MRRAAWTFLALLLAFGLVFYTVPGLLMARGSASARVAVARVYEASVRDYRDAALSPEALATLKGWDDELGKPVSWTIAAVDTQALGRPSVVVVKVRRGRGETEETLSLADSVTVSGAARSRFSSPP